jgi:hypothetical protein
METGNFSQGSTALKCRDWAVLVSADAYAEALQLYASGLQKKTRNKDFKDLALGIEQSPPILTKITTAVYTMASEQRLRTYREWLKAQNRSIAELDALASVPPSSLSHQEAGELRQLRL